MLLGGLAAIYWYLGRLAMKQGESIPGFRELVFRNLSLRRGRTISAVSLLALGTFIVMITGANHKTFYGAETNPASGTGGFLLWGETMLPIQDDLNSAYGGSKFGLRDEKILEPVRYIQFSQVSGDDASCLNLNQVSTPGILGVPASLFDRQKAFSFISTDPSADKDHPWKTLTTRLGPNTVPGFADQTVITWGLRKSVGDTLVYRDESGGLLYIKLMGGLDNSIFQGHLLVSDSLLRIFFPSAGASRQMLVDAPPAMRDTITQRLESLMRDQGLSLTPASARLAAFNAVENTYLTVFMMLGGLGMLIGTVGLGIVLLRNIRQRRQELALYLALGFRPDFIHRCILAEHLVILLSALILGIISSLTGILPSLLTPEYSAPVVFIGVILLLMGINGFLWIWFPARSALKKDILPGLRDE
jgi:ABC-type antimicrobial peptide transport system permease subunit